jgi:hypothetical protein
MSEAKTTTEYGKGMEFGQAWVIGSLPTFKRAADSILKAAEEWRARKFADSTDELRSRILVELWLTAMDWQKTVDESK